MDSDVIRRLRDRLVGHGRPSILPGGDGSDDGPTGPDRGAHDQGASRERVAPLAELLFLAMHADGQATDSEQLAVRGAVRTLTDGLVPGRVSDTMVDAFEEQLARDGYEARLHTVTQRIAADRDDAELGVLLFAAVALSDGVVDAAEREAFERVAEELGVSPPRLAQLLGDVP